ncbi:MAG TPA: hypothetical protein VLF62_02975, partial [Candidatus Saccharimonadales bacterium]|nr:hypothetical protein [Candidatus Saccharimonadales bacterium]
MGQIFSERCTKGSAGVPYSYCDIPASTRFGTCGQLTELGFGRQELPPGEQPYSPYGGQACPGPAFLQSAGRNALRFCSLPGELTEFFVPQYPDVPYSMVQDAAIAIANGDILPYDIPAQQASAAENILAWGGLMRTLDA